MRYNILFAITVISVLFSCRTEEGCKIGENYVKEENYHIVLSAKPENYLETELGIIQLKGKI